jgi:hypothetical protein
LRLVRNGDSLAIESRANGFAMARDGDPEAVRTAGGADIITEILKEVEAIIPGKESRMNQQDGLAGILEPIGDRRHRAGDESLEALPVARIISLVGVENDLPVDAEFSGLGLQGVEK